MDIKNGMLKTQFYNNVTVTASSVWENPTYYYANKVENLLDFDSCELCRWWSRSVEKSYVIFSFKYEFIIGAYSIQSYGDVYPTSWNVYYSLGDDDWKLLHYQKENSFFSEKNNAKKFFVKPKLIKKIKFEQLTSNYIVDSEYKHCFVLKRVDFFQKEARYTMKKCSSSIVHVFLVVLLLVQS